MQTYFYYFSNIPIYFVISQIYICCCQWVRSLTQLPNLRRRAVSGISTKYSNMYETYKLTSQVHVPMPKCEPSMSQLRSNRAPTPPPLFDFIQLLNLDIRSQFSIFYLFGTRKHFVELLTLLKKDFKVCFSFFSLLFINIFCFLY